MYFKNLLFSILLILTTNCLVAQKVIHGRVISADSIGVGYATIETNSNQTVANNKGFFEIKYQGSELNIKVRHVGYEVYLDTLSPASDTNYLTIQLNQTELDSFTLTEKRNVDLVLDFEISQGVMYSLTRRDNEKWIKAYDLNKTWLLTKVVSRDALEMKKDCFGNVHLLSGDSGIQVFVSNNEIITISKYSIDDFNVQIAPCKVSLKNRIVVAKYSQHNQQLIIDLFYQKK